MFLRDQHNARRFYHQNSSGRGGRADVSALCDTNGRPIERIKYSAYGTPITLTDIDFNSDGNLDPDDPGDFVNTPYDWNLDGSTNGSDTTDFQAAYNAVSGNAYGRGYASLAGHGNRIGYAGYIYDLFISGSDGGKWHVRHRVLDSGLGRWTRRDPLGYVDGVGLYEYVEALPIEAVDPYGLCTFPDNRGVPDAQRYAVCDAWAGCQVGASGIMVASPACRAQAETAGRQCCQAGGSEAKCSQVVAQALRNCTGTAVRIVVGSPFPFDCAYECFKCSLWLIGSEMLCNAMSPPLCMATLMVILGSEAFPQSCRNCFECYYYYFDV